MKTKDFFPKCLAQQHGCALYMGAYYPWQKTVVSIWIDQARDYPPVSWGATSIGLLLYCCGRLREGCGPGKELLSSRGEVGGKAGGCWISTEAVAGMSTAWYVPVCTVVGWGQARLLPWKLLLE